ncbi:PREDICTED: metallo-beta-lactamase domain-containing protein 1 isoform X1 [Acromyrmex echinatior]
MKYKKIYNDNRFIKFGSKRISIMCVRHLIRRIRIKSDNLTFSKVKDGVLEQEQYRNFRLQFFLKYKPLPTKMCEVIVLFNGYSKNLGNGKMDANCTCTLIIGPKLIIVDTMTAWDREILIEALAQYNIEPKDIDYVVCTHSHSDHIGNNNLFTKAQHIVGLTVQCHTIFYENLISDKGYKLCSDVNVIATPGHTKEDVTVLVNTTMDGEAKLIAITGDLFEKEEDILDPHIWKSLGTPELLKTQSVMRSHIIDLADFIIPGHGSMFCVTDTMRKAVKCQVIQ